MSKLHLYRVLITISKNSFQRVFPIFVIGTTLYICMSALPFRYVFPLILTKLITMFTVLSRHAHSD